MISLEYDSVVEYDNTQAIEVVITIKNGSLAHKFVATLDTGADFCFFQPDIAEVLGLELKAGLPLKVSSAAGGTFDAYGHEVQIECHGTEFTSTVYFADVPNFRRNVLGRLGWLEQFRVGLVHHDSKLYLGHYNAQTS